MTIRVTMRIVVAVLFLAVGLAAQQNTTSAPASTASPATTTAAPVTTPTPQNTPVPQTPPPSPPTPAPTATPAPPGGLAGDTEYTENQKFGISCATFASLTAAWALFCFAYAKIADKFGDEAKGPKYAVVPQASKI